MVNLTLQSGTVVPLSLNYKLQAILREKMPDAYKRGSAAMAEIRNGDMFMPWANIIYMGYLCAAIGGGKYDTAMAYEDFLEDLPEDMGEISKIGSELVSPKKKTASEELSSEQ